MWRSKKLRVFAFNRLLIMPRMSNLRVDSPRSAAFFHNNSSEAACKTGLAQDIKHGAIPLR